MSPRRKGAPGGCSGRAWNGGQGSCQAAAAGAQLQVLPCLEGKALRGPAAGQGARGGWSPCSAASAGNAGRGGSCQPSQIVSAANAVSLLLRRSPCQCKSPTTVFSRKEANPISRITGPAVSR